MVNYILELMLMRRENIMLRIELAQCKMKNPAYEQARLKEVENLIRVIKKLGNKK